MSHANDIQNVIQVAALALIAEELEDEEQRANKKKRLWVRDWVSRRPQEVPLFGEVYKEDRSKFFMDFRMFPEDFEKLLLR